MATTTDSPLHGCHGDAGGNDADVFQHNPFATSAAAPAGSMTNPFASREVSSGAPAIIPRDVGSNDAHEAHQQQRQGPVDHVEAGALVTGIGAGMVASSSEPDLSAGNGVSVHDFLSQMLGDLSTLQSEMMSRSPRRLRPARSHGRLHTEGSRHGGSGADAVDDHACPPGEGINAAAKDVFASPPRVPQGSLPDLSSPSLVTSTPTARPLGGAGSVTPNSSLSSSMSSSMSALSIDGTRAPTPNSRRFMVARWNLTESVASLQDMCDASNGSLRRTNRGSITSDSAIASAAMSSPPTAAASASASAAGSAVPPPSSASPSPSHVARRSTSASLRRTSSLCASPGKHSLPLPDGTPQLTAPHTTASTPKEFSSTNAVRLEQVALGTVFDWFCPGLSRSDVDKYLADGTDGSFVVRQSTAAPEHLVLCLKYGTLVLHFLLARQTGGDFQGGCLLSGGTVVYRSLVSFVAHHTLVRGALPCLLRLPVGTSLEVPAAVKTEPSQPEEALLPHTDEPKEELHFEEEEEMQRGRTVSQPNVHTLDDSSSMSTGGRESFAAQRVGSVLSSLKGLLPRLRQKRAKGVATRRCASLVNKIISSPRSPERRTISNFVVCTRESDDTDPGLVMQNVRQFLDGMRNYIFSQHGDRLYATAAKFTDPAAGEDPDSVDLDGIIEAALVAAVVEPLSLHMYSCVSDSLEASGERQKLQAGFDRLRNCTPEQLGVNAELVLPDWEPSVVALRRIGKHASPLRKLQSLLAAVQLLHDSVATHLQEQPTNAVLGADDFLPLFIFTLLQTGLGEVEVYAEYMWGLLDPSLLSGEGGYYLTTLSSAILVLKTYQVDSQPPQLPERVPCLEDMQGFLRVYFPDRDRVLEAMPVFKTLSVGPGVTVAQTCTKIARKFHLPNPDAYGLFESADGQETLLQPNQFPQHLKAEWPETRTTTSHFFAFKLRKPQQNK
eukprot:m.30554 g.30554  ORF g.30554 m.30554 type:complete len:951 (+) comp9477_c0_seq1:310-3162(+)